MFVTTSFYMISNGLCAVHGKKGGNQFRHSFWWNRWKPPKCRRQFQYPSYLVKWRLYDSLHLTRLSRIRSYLRLIGTKTGVAVLRCTGNVDAGAAFSFVLQLVILYWLVMMQKRKVTHCHKEAVLRRSVCPLWRQLYVGHHVEKLGFSYL